MKTGSLVMLKDLPIVAEPNLGEIFPKPKTVYTVRDIYNCNGHPSILLEEIINPIAPEDGREYAWWAECFNELLPPMEAEMKELLSQPELLPA